MAEIVPVGASVAIARAEAVSLRLAGSPAADQRPARVYLARLAPGSRPAQAAALATMAAMLAGEGTSPDLLPWGQLRYQHTAALRQLLAERYAPATVNRHLAALRGVLREAHRLGQMGAEDYYRAADVAAVKGDRLPAGRAVAGGELRALFAACAGRPQPRRRQP